MMMMMMTTTPITVMTTTTMDDDDGIPMHALLANFQVNAYPFRRPVHKYNIAYTCRQYTSQAQFTTDDTLTREVVECLRSSQLPRQDKLNRRYQTISTTIPSPGMQAGPNYPTRQNGRIYNHRCHLFPVPLYITEVCCTQFLYTVHRNKIRTPHFSVRHFRFQRRTLFTKKNIELL